MVNRIRNVASMNKLIFVTCGWLVLGMPVHAASFDCDKAHFSIEKMICADDELSDLDEKLAETYQAALKHAANPNALKLRQQGWLKDLRHYCQTSQCLKGAYSTRITALLNGNGAKFYDTLALKTKREADKAAKVQVILAQQPMRPRKLVQAKNRAFCGQFYEALRTASPTIKYIEPVLRTDDPTHPGLGAYLACDDYQPKDAYKYFMMNELGRRGFRLYRLDLDGDPKNGLEEYLYGQEPENTFNTLAAQLLSVNFKKCDIENAVAATPEHPLDPTGNNGSSGINALTRYHGRYYFYDLAHIGSQGDYYSIALTAYDQYKRSFIPNICIWAVPDNK